MPTQKIIAEYLDLNQSNVSRLMAELGIDWKTATLDEILHAYLNKLRAHPANQPRSANADLAHERGLTERVDRELMAMELEEKKHNVVILQQLEPMLADMVAFFRSTLAELGERLKTDIDSIHGIDADAKLISEHVMAPLSQLTKYDKVQTSARHEV
jgi:hypothetical protein